MEATGTKKESTGKRAVKTTDKKTPGAHILHGEGGKTIIHKEVVGKIAGLAVREIEGVYRLVSYGAGQAVASLASQITRSDLKDLGISVEVGEKEAAVDVKIIAEYGYSIPEIADAIRVNLNDRIMEMTGLKVVDVNIEILDLYFPSDAEEPIDHVESTRVR